eukprot:154723-Pyramimonas_sp.AAC.2
MLTVDRWLLMCAKVGLATTYGNNENNVWEWGNRTLDTTADLHAVIFVDAEHGYCTALYWTALHCTALYCTALYCAALCCTALHCTALHCTALYCTVRYGY